MGNGFLRGLAGEGGLAQLLSLWFSSLYRKGTYVLSGIRAVLWREAHGISEARMRPGLEPSKSEHLGMRKDRAKGLGGKTASVGLKIIYEDSKRARGQRRPTR